VSFPDGALPSPYVDCLTPRSDFPRSQRHAMEVQPPQTAWLALRLPWQWHRRPGNDYRADGHASRGLHFYGCMLNLITRTGAAGLDFPTVGLDSRRFDSVGARFNDNGAQIGRRRGQFDDIYAGEAELNLWGQGRQRWWGGRQARRQGGSR
jgi:hypothetical protein